MIKRIVFGATALLLVGCNSQTSGSSSAAKSEPGKAPPEDVAQNPDVSAVVAAIDNNRDGRMSRLEWARAGAPQSSFDGLDKSKRGYVTKADMDGAPAPPGVDLDGDGKLTLDEFKEFDRRMGRKSK